MIRGHLGVALFISVLLHALMLLVPAGTAENHGARKSGPFEVALLPRPLSPPIAPQAESSSKDTYASSRRETDRADTSDSSQRLDHRHLIDNALAPRYFRSSEVDVRAEPVTPPAIVIPERAYLSRITGTVRLRVFISESGTVAAIEVIEVAPAGYLFEQAAVTAVQQTRFSPAMLNGRPVRNVKELSISLDPYETIGHP